MVVVGVRKNPEQFLHDCVVAVLHCRFQGFFYLVISGDDAGGA
jgi:hypothetical protein